MKNRYQVANSLAIKKKEILQQVNKEYIDSGKTDLLTYKLYLFKFNTVKGFYSFLIDEITASKLILFLQLFIIVVLSIPILLEHISFLLFIPAFSIAVLVNNFEINKKHLSIAIITYSLIIEMFFYTSFVQNTIQVSPGIPDQTALNKFFVIVLFSLTLMNLGFVVIFGQIIKFTSLFVNTIKKIGAIIIDKKEKRTCR